MKLIPSITVYRGRVGVARGTGYAYLRNSDGRFRSPVNLARELDSQEIFLIDIDGLERDRPNLGVIKRIAAYRDVWLDAGTGTVDDMMDMFVSDAERVVMGTKAAPSIGMLEEAASMSDRILLSLDMDGSVISPCGELAGLEPVRAAGMLAHRTGIPSAILFDLGGIRDRRKPDAALVSGLAGLFDELYVCGHLEPGDANWLEDAGASGMILEHGHFTGGEGA